MRMRATTRSPSRWNSAASMTTGIGSSRHGRDSSDTDPAVGAHRQVVHDVACALRGEQPVGVAAGGRPDRYAGRTASTRRWAGDRAYWPARHCSSIGRIFPSPSVDDVLLVHHVVQPAEGELDTVHRGIERDTVVGGRSAPAQRPVDRLDRAEHRGVRRHRAGSTRGSRRGSPRPNVGSGDRTAGNARPRSPMIGPRVARWYICSAESDRSTPIHCTSANSSVAPAGQGQQRGSADPEHPGGHVGSLDVPAEPPHLERLVAGHRRSAGRRRAGGCRRSPGSSKRSRRRRSIEVGRCAPHEQRQVVDRRPRPRGASPLGTCGGSHGSVRSTRRCCWRARDRRGGTARRPTPSDATTSIESLPAGAGDRDE